MITCDEFEKQNAESYFIAHQMMAWDTVFPNLSNEDLEKIARFSEEAKKAKAMFEIKDLAKTIETIDEPSGNKNSFGDAVAKRLMSDAFMSFSDGVLER